MFYLFFIKLNLLFALIATPKLYMIMHIISELINPFKQCSPYVYTLKICIDIPKELIKMYMIVK